MKVRVDSSNRLFQFGVAYYPDYIQEGHLGRTIDGMIRPMSFEERLEQDFLRMVRAGIREIRMGEFAWSTLEPEPGVFRPDCFLAALEKASAHSISVVFCTPTATPPKWLVDRMPDMLPRDAHGHVHAFGSRRHYDPCHPGFRQEARRITERVAKAFGSHPAVIAWQIDNELGHHGTHECRSPAAQTAFTEWLKARYEGEIERLNHEWFTAFWSQRYRSFEEIEIPKFTWAGVGPHIEMAYRHFYNDVYRKFQAEQIQILREHTPGHSITTNLISNFYGLCPWQLTADLDVVGYDHYQDDPYPDPIRSAVNFTLMRSLKGQKFKVLEQQPVQVNWQKINRRFRLDWLWLWAFQAAAYGAEGMHYFSWQRFSGGPEQYHDAVLPHDVRNPQSQQEQILAASHQFFRLCEQRLGWKELPRVKEDVLIVHNTESLWSHRICAQSEHYDATTEMDRIAKLCSLLGLGFRFVEVIPKDWHAYPEARYLFLPGYAFELTERERQSLHTFISSGGLVLSFPRTAMKKRDQHMSPLPGSILDHNSYYFVEYGAMGPEEQETINCGPYHFEAERWAEYIALSTDSSYHVLAYFSDGIYQKRPAIIERKLGKGAHIHLAFCPKINQDFLAWLAEFSSLSPHLKIPSEAQMQVIPLKSGQNEWLSLLNFDEKSVPFSLGNSFEPELCLNLTHNLELEFSLDGPMPTGCPPRSITLMRKRS